jgi:hypothetical protein
MLPLTRAGALTLTGRKQPFRLCLVAHFAALRPDKALQSRGVFAGSGAQAARLSAPALPQSDSDAVGSVVARYTVVQHRRCFTCRHHACPSTTFALSPRIPPP